MGVGVGTRTGRAMGTGIGVDPGIGVDVAVANGGGAGAIVGAATRGELIVGMSVGSGGAVGKAICAGVGAGVGVGSGSKTVKANRLKLSTLAVAVEAPKSTTVANGFQAPPVWCWMTILSGFPAARAASAVLSVTVIVIGFNSGVSVVSSKALPVAVNLAGRAGISARDRET